MALPHPIPDPLVDLIGQRLRVIGEPMRIKLLDCLADGERTVQELTAALDGSQQNVSRHLGVLHQAGILIRRKRGINVCYTLVDKSALELIESASLGVARHLDELSQAIDRDAPED